MSRLSPRRPRFLYGRSYSSASPITSLSTVSLGKMRPSSSTVTAQPAEDWDAVVAAHHHVNEHDVEDRRKTARELVDMVCEAVLEFSGRGRPADDVTAMVIKVES